MEITEKQLGIMVAEGHLFVSGGPGSGKTTISILKAAKCAECELLPGQKILFLSFARATVSRIIETIEYEQKIPLEQKKRIDVETYHSFFWRILKTHGYLIGLPRRLHILTPPNEAVALSVIRNNYSSKSKLSKPDGARKQKEESSELNRLAIHEGRICFDLFAKYAGDILHRSKRIRKLVATMYPVIILDEFQDTNAEQWRVVQALGESSRLIALADPEQRIYDWIGADPERPNHFKKSFLPTEIDLCTENHRSIGTDIAAFGNDILKGKYRDKPYKGLEIICYLPNESQAFTALVTTTYNSRKRLIGNGKRNWSLAILVPTKRMTRLVSDHFRTPPASMKPISHNAIIEMEAVILAAEMVSFLMQPDTDGRHFGYFIELLINYFYGKGGDNPAKSDLKEAENIQKAYKEWIVRQAEKKAIRQSSILVNLINCYSSTRMLNLTGDPDKDWRAVRQVMETGACQRLKEVANEVRNLRLLERGTQLRQELSEDWRENGFYANALTIIRRAFVKEHFSTNSKPETGVVIMNMHKAKGKQFDEVIIFEGWPKVSRGKIMANSDRIVRRNLIENINDQTIYNFRVSVTRGKRQTTILTPKNDPCVLLYNRK